MQVPGGAALIGPDLPFPAQPRPAGVYVLSFPKSGRTWLRLLLAKAISTQYRLPMRLFEQLRFDGMHRADPRIPLIEFWHDDQPGWRLPEELSTDKSGYDGARVIFLLRDLRDLAVSLFFQRTRRPDLPFAGTLEEFLTESRGSLATCIEYWNIWHASRTVPAAFLWCGYEQLTRDPHGQLDRILRFCQLPEAPTEQALSAAVDYAGFANMRLLELADAFGSDKLRPGDPADPESFKTRRGVVGGYRDYLSPAQSGLVQRLVRDRLVPQLQAAGLAAGPAGPSR